MIITHYLYFMAWTSTFGFTTILYFYPKHLKKTYFLTLKISLFLWFMSFKPKYLLPKIFKNFLFSKSQKYLVSCKYIINSF